MCQDWQIILCCKYILASDFGGKYVSWVRSMMWLSAKQDQIGVFAVISMSVFVNGSPTDEFKLERGLRQYDSFSPFHCCRRIKCYAKCYYIG